MSRVTAQISVSLDGFAAGPDQRPEQPLGDGGERLHEWVVRTASWRRAHGLEGGEQGPDSEITERLLATVGAQVMGRRMFGGGEGAWDPAWRGWWGEDPPFRTAVFVLTHHPREPLAFANGTTFTFVTGGLEAALEQARAAAGGRDVQLSGGASVIAQALAAGVLDELTLHVAPVLLHDGTRLFEGAGDPVLEPAGVLHSPAVTHVTYRVLR